MSAKQIFECWIYFKLSVLFFLLHARYFCGDLIFFLMDDLVLWFWLLSLNDIGNKVGNECQEREARSHIETGIVVPRYVIKPACGRKAASLETISHIGVIDLSFFTTVIALIIVVVFEFRIKIAKNKRNT